MTVTGAGVTVLVMVFVAVVNLSALEFSHMLESKIPTYR